MVDKATEFNEADHAVFDPNDPHYDPNYAALFRKLRERAARAHVKEACSRLYTGLADGRDTKRDTWSFTGPRRRRTTLAQAGGALATLETAPQGRRRSSIAQAPPGFRLEPKFDRYADEMQKALNDNRFERYYDEKHVEYPTSIRPLLKLDDNIVIEQFRFMKIDQHEFKDTDSSTESSTTGTSSAGSSGSETSSEGSSEPSFEDNIRRFDNWVQDILRGT